VRSGVEHYIVDQARLAYSRCDCDQDWTIKRRMTRQRFGIYCFYVFDLDSFRPLQDSGCCEHYFLGAAWVGAMLVAGGA
jgi:hypothetical protein